MGNEIYLVYATTENLNFKWKQWRRTFLILRGELFLRSLAPMQVQAGPFLSSDCVLCTRLSWSKALNSYFSETWSSFIPVIEMYMIPDAMAIIIDSIPFTRIMHAINLQ